MPRDFLSKGKGMKPKDITNQRFGRLIALEYKGKDQSHKYALWLCQCDCGNQKIVRLANFGRTKSCGCLVKEKSAETGKNRIKHGHTKDDKSSGIYTTWHAMKQRCLNPKYTYYKDYGGRGITICNRWLGEHGFENFLKDVGPRPQGTTADRKDNDGNYEPENFAWATKKEQAHNQRSKTLDFVKEKGLYNEFVSWCKHDKERIRVVREPNNDL